jgi:transcriptional regulator with XRE-family HTH domain
MKMATGSNIRTLRNLAGLTLEQLSELSGVEVGTISALENRDSARSKYFPSIAQAFGITTDDLSSEITSEQIARAAQNRYQMRDNDVPNWPTTSEIVAAVFDKVNPSRKPDSKASHIEQFHTDQLVSELARRLVGLPEIEMRNVLIQIELQVTRSSPPKQANDGR